MKCTILFVTSFCLFLWPAGEACSQKKTVAKPTPWQVYKKLELRVVAVMRTEKWNEKHLGFSITPKEGCEFVVVRLEIKPQEPIKRFDVDFDFFVLDEDSNKYESSIEIKGTIRWFGTGSPTVFPIEFPFDIPKGTRIRFKTFNIERHSFEIERHSFDIEDLAAKI